MTDPYEQELYQAIYSAFGIPAELMEGDNSQRASSQAMQDFYDRLYDAIQEAIEVLADWIGRVNEAYLRAIAFLHTREFWFAMLMDGYISWNDFFKLFPDALDNPDIRWEYQKYIWGLILNSPKRLYRWLVGKVKYGRKTEETF